MADLSTLSIVFIVIGGVVAILIVVFLILIVRQGLAKRNEKPTRGPRDAESGRTLGGFGSLHGSSNRQNTSDQTTTSFTTFGQETPTAPSHPDYGYHVSPSTRGECQDQTTSSNRPEIYNGIEYNDTPSNSDYRDGSDMMTSPEGNTGGDTQNSHTDYSRLRQANNNMKNPYDSLNPKEESKHEPFPPETASSPAGNIESQNSPYILAQPIGHASASTQSPVIVDRVKREINGVGDDEDESGQTYDNSKGNRNTYFELEKLDDSGELHLPSEKNTGFYFELEKTGDK